DEMPVRSTVNAHMLLAEKLLRKVSKRHLIVQIHCSSFLYIDVPAIAMRCVRRFPSVLEIQQTARRQTHIVDHELFASAEIEAFGEVKRFVDQVLLAPMVVRMIVRRTEKLREC